MASYSMCIAIYIDMTWLYFIVFVGVLIVSGVVLYCYFWLLFVCHLALKVFFPLKSDKLFNSDHSTIFYIAEVIIIFLIGTIPSIVFASVGSNYRVIGFPPIFCALDSTYRIYAMVGPILITNGASVILMLLVIYKLHMVSLIVHM